MDKNKIIEECNNLYSDIDSCIDELLKARIDHDTEAEGEALFRMEGLMVGTQQNLSWIVDQLSKEELPAGLDEAFCSFIDSTEYSPANQDEERMALAAFKAGAKWAFRQGDIVETTVIKDENPYDDFSGPWSSNIIKCDTKYQINEKVIVQIRKCNE